MIIAVSGVPGVGKTKAAKILAKKLGASVISIAALVEAGKIPYAWDKVRRTRVVSAKDVQKAVNAAMKGKSRTFVIEGHLAHLLDADAVFILRCEPSMLRRRLRARRWRAAKIEENVQAEMLDSTTAEALERKDRRVYEIDTTHRSATQTAAIMLRILRSAAYAARFRPGRVRWLARAMQNSNSLAVLSRRRFPA
ncbi:MAG: AAA family ATPase [Candidatus Aenigmatarchaeota archaeon]